MLNLALMTLSASSLERRLTVMQPRPRVAPALTGTATVSAMALAMGACFTTPPDAPEQATVAAAAPETGSPWPTLEDLKLSPDSMVQRAAQRTYGDHLPRSAGRPARLWFTFNRDWSVRQHAEGAAGLVEAPGWRTDPSWAGKKGPVYTVRESVEKRFGITINDSRIVSHYGGSRAVIGSDTAWVFYARYAQ